METSFADPELGVVILGCGIALLAGFVKGIVGFALPMILISGLSSVMPPTQALGALILPTLATNGMQALRQGPQAALASISRFRIFMLVGLCFLLLAAQLVAILPPTLMLGAIGAVVVCFAALQLAGWQPRLRPSARVEFGFGAIAGFIGGLSGVWGPPTVMYLTALATEKTEQMRVQGVIYGLGAVALTVAHLGSGVLTARIALLSAILVPAAVLGMVLGGRLQDRIDQTAFRRATLAVLCIAGLNLLRRAVL